jgi:N6-adenosine-specific RNA methylase IME4/ParB-like chromosome segregation protein Spo0J
VYNPSRFRLVFCGVEKLIKGVEVMDKEYQFHPACLVLPKMDAEEFNALRESIRKGFDRQHPVILFEGKVLDGRHRVEACKLEGIEPVFVTKADIDPYDYVRREHAARRSWKSQEQKALVIGVLIEASDEYQVALAKIRDEANRARAEAAIERERETTETGKTIFKSQVAPQCEVRLEHRKHNTPGADAKAAILEVSRPAVERAAIIKKKAPELAAKVASGEITACAALREIKKQEVITSLEDISTKKVKALDGVYDAIVIDPPWPMQKIERDVRPNQVEFDYPTMQEDELAAMKIPAADSCHLWLWTTHKFLPMAFRLLDAWGFKYVCAFVWHKPGGYQPLGLPQYNCEFALYARKGTPSFIDTKAFPVCFEAPRGKHSEKPEEFYEVVRRVTAGRRVDMFNRRPIEGFDTWGNEAEQ